MDLLVMRTGNRECVAECVSVSVCVCLWGLTTSVAKCDDISHWLRQETRNEFYSKLAQIG